MYNRNRLIILGALLLAGVLLADVMVYGYMSGQQRRVESARVDYEGVRKDAAEIVRRRNSALPYDQNEAAAMMTSLVEQAAAGSGITGTSLVRIDPESPKQIGRTAYKERPTTVVLREVSLPSAVQLAAAVTQRNRDVYVKRISVSAIDRRPGLWNIDLTLAYVVFDPQQEPR